MEKKEITKELWKIRNLIAQGEIDETIELIEELISAIE
jgi:hypothetical protein